MPIERQPLKLLSRDRRIDPGMKYSPVLGRYAFLKELNGALCVRVGGLFANWL